MKKYRLLTALLLATCLTTTSVHTIFAEEEPEMGGPIDQSVRLRVDDIAGNGAIDYGSLGTWSIGATNNITINVDPIPKTPFLPEVGGQYRMEPYTIYRPQFSYMLTKDTAYIYYSLSRYDLQSANYILQNFDDCKTYNVGRVHDENISKTSPLILQDGTEHMLSLSENEVTYYYQMTRGLDWPKPRLGLEAGIRLIEATPHQISDPLLESYYRIDVALDRIALGTFRSYLGFDWYGAVPIYECILPDSRVVTIVCEKAQLEEWILNNMGYVLITMYMPIDPNNNEPLRAEMVMQKN